MSTGREARVELLLGRKVVDSTGETIGRLEELRVERWGEEDVITEFHVGSGAGVERLGGTRLGLGWIRLGRGDGTHGYVVPWEMMDLSDPEHPRTTRPCAELPTRESSAPPKTPSA